MLPVSDFMAKVYVVKGFFNQMILWIKEKGELYQLKVPKKFKIVYVPLKCLSLFANRAFDKGGTVAKLNGEITRSSVASPEAVQLDEKHFIDTKYYVISDFINHSCNPNTKIDFVKNAFVAIRKIGKNEEITYNYLTTEFDMRNLKTDFKCSCNSKECFKNIKGFRYLTLKQKIKIKSLLSPFILTKLKKYTLSADDNSFK